MVNKMKFIHWVVIPCAAMLLGVSAMAGFVDERKADAGKTESTSKELAATTAAPVTQPVEVKPAATVELVAGKLMGDELQKIAPSGWKVVWDAADYTLGQSMTVTNDFDKAVTEVMEAANGAGTRIKAKFWHGNNILRVIEF